ncbi:ArsR/SmtB family transcription factor [Streptomyces javensis]|uniref:ArsR/SmtB family transcription factor n=1 Tax=Streptomyces javensis TaxID=114698 RepID=UPI0031E1AEB4
MQSRGGRWAYADWYRTTLERVHKRGLNRLLREVLLPLFPRAVYFPDFLTPSQSEHGLEAGLESILGTPRHRVERELALFTHIVGAPPWAGRLTGIAGREELVRAIRTYYEAAVAPCDDPLRARTEAERAARARDLLDGGVHGMLAGLGPTMRWRPPVLYVDYPAEHDLRLNGRGLRLVPSYFCWRTPVTMANPELPPVLFYPLLRASSPTAAEPHARPHGPAGPDAPTAPLTALLGRTRATVLCAAAAGAGATTGELARAVGVSVSSASKHATVLREAGLLSSSRYAASVLHTLTPVGASALRASRSAPA